VRDEAAHPFVRSTGKIGDGKVWVIPIEARYRTRTGESRVDAL